MHETGTITQGDMEEGTLSTGENGEIDLRSEEVQEIMGRMPTWVERWGILSIAIMLAALLCGAAYFPYPDTLGGGFVYVPGKAEDGVPSSCFALMPVHGIGKVKEGMPVRVVLENYPESEFGYLRGTVHDVAPLPDENWKYRVGVELPKGMDTSLGLSLPCHVQMEGRAEIVVADRRLIDKIGVFRLKVGK
ncbi:MAG: hypothetical protein ACI3X7_07305 [Bacteroidaceae bacterium]